MFTGLVEQKGTVLARVNQSSGIRLVIAADFESLQAGESIAVNGVCLTYLPSETDQLSFDISPETKALTNLGLLEVGDKVHLERALRLDDRLGGHYVHGHVDTTANVKALSTKGEYTEMVIDGFSAEQMRYLCLKGSVALDGVSLTINACDTTDDANCMTVMLIPHTLAKTTLATWQVGRCINVEFDYIARLVVHQLGSLSNSTIMSLFERSFEGKEVLV